MRPEEKSVTKEKTGEIAIFVFISDLCSSPVSCKICYVETVACWGATTHKYAL